MNETNVQNLQARVHELERRLAEARAMIAALKEAGGNESGPNGTAYSDTDQSLLLANEERLRSALFIAPFPLMIRREDGKVLMINQAWTAITGYTLDDIPTIGEWARKAYGARAVTTQSLIMKEGFSGEGTRRWGELEVMTRTGETRIWDFSTVPLGVDQKQRRILMAMAVDVTERKRAEQALRESERKFAALFDKAPFAAGLSKLPEGALVNVNEAFERIFGYSRKEVLGKNSLEAGINLDAESRVRVGKELEAGRSIRDWEVLLHKKSGEVGVFLVNVNLLDIAGGKYILQTAQDITERKRAEEKLRESEKRFRALIENGSDQVSILSSDGTLLYENPSVNPTLYYRPNQFLGQNILQLVHPDDMDRVQSLFQQLVQDAAFHPRDEFRLRASDGSWRWVEAVGTNLLDEPTVHGIVINYHDVTDRKRAEQALQESERQQRELARLLELDRAQLSTILENLPVGVWISDEQGKLISKNAEADRIWAGAAPLSESIEEYSQYVAWDPGTNERLQLEEYPAVKVLRTGEPTGPTELKIQRFDGSQGTVLVSAAPIMDTRHQLTGVVSVNTDITARKAAEKAMQEAHDRAQWLARFPYENPNPVARVTAEGIVLYHNPAAEKLGGWLLSVGKPAPDAFLVLVKAAMLSGQAVEEDIQLAGRNYSVSVMPIVEEGYANLYGLDITERNRIEEALRESEQRYRGLFERMQEGLVAAEVITDENGKPIDYRYIDVNPATERQFGIPREGFVGHTYTEVLPEGDPEWIEIFGEVARTGRPMRLERYGKASKHWFECHLYSPFPGQVVNITNDITERKKAEQALRKSEAKLRAVFRALVEGVVFLNPQGEVEDVNETVERSFGHEVLELKDSRLNPRARIIRPDGTPFPVDEQPAMIALHSGQAVRGVELGVPMPDGTISWRLANAQPVYDDHGTLLGAAASFFDITERKQTEQHLAYQANLLANVNDAIVGSDAHYQITVWNATAESIYGWKAEEVLGRNGIELLQTQWPQEAAEEMRRKIAETGRWRGEATQLRKDGVRIPVEVSSMVLRDERGQVTGYVSVNRDITDRKRAEEALRETEERFSKAFQKAPFGMHITRLEDGAFIDVNNAWLKMFGWSKGEVLGKTTAELGCYARPEDRDAIRDRIVNDEAMDDMELQVVRKDGSGFTITAATTLIDLQGERCILTVVNDITGRKEAEQALRESESRFRSLADSMPQLVWTARPDGTVDYYNQRYKEYHGFRQAEGESWEWAPVLYPDDVQSTVQAWQRAVTTGETYQAEHRVRMADGSYRWHLSRGVPMQDEQGRIVRWFGTATDIHSLKRALEKLNEYAHRLERSNRDLEEFAYVASHDLQEPLRKVEAFGAALYEISTTLSEKQRDYIDRMRNAAGRMRSMVDGLLMLSRLDRATQPFVSVDLQKVVSGALSALEMQIKRTGGQVEVGHLPTIQADPLQMHQLMQNLIGNALKFHRKDVPPYVRVHVREAPEAVELIVEDNGIGFQQSDADRIFQPFQRLVARSEYAGSGMGLAICRKIVERHNGTITVKSMPGIGSTFVVTLPVQQTNGY